MIANRVIYVYVVIDISINEYISFDMLFIS